MSRPVSSTRIVRTSLLVDLLDVLLNMFVALVTGSAVMLAEALQGSADLLTTILLLVGVKRSRRRADHNHPYGHGREIYFWTLMSGIVMLTITSTASIYHGISHLIAPQIIENVPLALMVLTIGLVTNSYAFHLSYQRLVSAHDGMSLWEIITSSSMVEIKATFILDLLGSISAVLGLSSLLLFSLSGNSQFDGIGAIAIGLSMALMATILVLDVKDLLIGRGAPESIEQEIKDTALAIKGVEDIEHLRTIYVGSDKLLVNLVLLVEPHLEAVQIERMIDIIRVELKAHIPVLQHVHIELKTVKRR